MSQMIFSGSAAAISSTKSQPPFGATVSHDAARLLAHRRLERGHHAGREAAADELAQLGVARSVHVDHRAEELEQLDGQVADVGAPARDEGLRVARDPHARRRSARADQKPGPLGKPMNSGSSWNDTGRSARSFAKMPSRSGRAHSSAEPSWMSSMRRSVDGIAVTWILLATIGIRRPTPRAARAAADRRGGGWADG